MLSLLASACSERVRELDISAAQAKQLGLKKHLRGDATDLTEDLTRCRWRPRPW
jgi:hypothetical protein